MSSASKISIEFANRRVKSARSKVKWFHYSFFDTVYCDPVLVSYAAELQ